MKLPNQNITTKNIHVNLYIKFVEVLINLFTNSLTSTMQSIRYINIKHMLGN